MVTNVTVFPVDGPVVIYYQDGSSQSIEAQTEHSFQLPEAKMCTISDTPPKQDNIEEGEHPPPGYAFAQAMVAFWQGMMDKIEAEVQDPEVNPL
jgi:hypothetical protein